MATNGAPDSWEDNSDEISTKMTALNVDAPSFVPNVNAAVFVPSFLAAAPPPAAAVLPAAAAPPPAAAASPSHTAAPVQEAAPPAPAEPNQMSVSCNLYDPYKVGNGLIFCSFPHL